jgi:mRNA interferase HigB
MRVFARRTLKEFVASRMGSQGHRALSAALDTWYANTIKSDWQSMADVKRAHSGASVVTSDRVVFNIKGNSYRLVAAIDFRKSIVFIKWLGTHSDYDKIDVRTVHYESRY